MDTIDVFLDDLRFPSDVYGEGADTAWVAVTTVEEVIQLLQQGNVARLSLDNDLGLGNKEGHTVIKWMIEHDIWPSEEIFVHSQNWVQVPKMRADIDRHFYCDAKIRKQKGD